MRDCEVIMEVIVFKLRIGYCTLLLFVVKLNLKTVKVELDRIIIS